MAILDLDLDLLRQRTSMKWTRFAPDVLPMWVAEMDLLSPPGVTGAVQHVLEIGDMGYPGYDSLPRAFADFAHALWGLTLDAKTLMPCADVVTGMAVLVDAFTPAGSEHRHQHADLPAVPRLGRRGRTAARRGHHDLRRADWTSSPRGCLRP
jgi:cystathionine beta-lyase